MAEYIKTKEKGAKSKFSWANKYEVMISVKKNFRAAKARTMKSVSNL